MLNCLRWAKYCQKSIFVAFLFASHMLLSGPAGPADSLARGKQLREATDFLSAYLQINSETGQEAEAGAFFAQYCESKGLFVHYFSTSADSYNFAASLYPLALGKPNIVLLNHIDVVPPGDTSVWLHQPYSGTIADGHIWGRGALDCKGLASMQLMALLAMKEKSVEGPFPYNITILSVSDEENGGRKGAKLITENYLEFLKPVVVLGEGGAGLSGVLNSKPDAKVYGVSVAEKNSLWLHLALKQNTFGHGATPTRDYANRLMIGALSRLNNAKVKLRFNRSNRLMFRKIGKAEGGLRGFIIRKFNWGIFTPLVKSIIKDDPLYRALVTNTVTVTNLNNPPGPPNQIADLSVALLDCRLLPGTNRKNFINRLKRILDEPAIEITILDASPEAEPTNPDEAYDALEKAILTYNPEAYVIPILFPATTDNSFFRAKGIPVYGLMPAVLDKEMIESIHSTNEKISFKALKSGIAIYTSFLENMMDVKQDQPRFPHLLIDATK